MDKFMKALDFDSDTLGNVKARYELCSAEIDRKHDGEREYEWKFDIEN